MTGRTARKLYRSLTSPLRLLPDFIVIGAQKGGTTFLYNLLNRHPNVLPATLKEVQYFSLHSDRSINWYRAHFPLPAYRQRRQATTGEASPYYLFHPHAARRAAKIVPTSKLIVLLRDPVDRAYSHYQHRCRKGIEALNFEEAVEAEKSRLGGELDKMLKNEHYNSFNHQHFSYLSRGIYVDQLAAWSRFFDANQMLILQTEAFFGDVAGTLERILQFLELPAWNPKLRRPRDNSRYSPMDPATRRRLYRHFEPHNQRLYEYLGVDYGW